ncbi:MAG: hypothetical protein ACM3UP_00600 [Methanocella sp.]
MTVVPVYESACYLGAVQRVLEAHLRSIFPQTKYDVTFEDPDLEEPSKPVIWLRLVKSADGRVAPFALGDDIVRLGVMKTLVYEVVVVTVEATGGSAAAWEIAGRFEHEAIVNGKAALGATGLKHADCTSFVLLPFPAPSKQWRMEAQLSFDVLVERR